MPFHILLSQSLSLLTGGLDIWKLAKDGVLAVATLITLLLVWQQKKRTRSFNFFVAATVVYGLIHLIVWAMNPSIFRDTALLGTLYNGRVPALLLLGMGAGLLAPRRFAMGRLTKVIVGASTLVCVLGLLQYFLPKDILTHLGYSVSRGVKPAFFIDDKPDLPRIMSSLRDPNSLGAYLIIPICLLIHELLAKKQTKRLLLGGLLVLHALALFLTFSRGAWGGAVLAVTTLLLLPGTLPSVPYKKLLVAGLVGGLVLLPTLYTARNTYTVQNVILHSDKSTVAPEDSNQLHVRLVRDGIVGVLHKPDGHGPGTAGIVSLHSPNGGHLTEDYYVQIGYEVGVVGLALFVALFGGAAWLLRKSASPLGRSLLAAAGAYAAMGLLMHIWTNEAVATEWWLLTGIVLANITMTAQRGKRYNDSTTSTKPSSVLTR